MADIDYQDSQGAEWFFRLNIPEINKFLDLLEDPKALSMTMTIVGTHPSRSSVWVDCEQGLPLSAGCNLDHYCAFPYIALDDM
jgi:hypothetical protein